jgi:hypothetical protein
MAIMKRAGHSNFTTTQNYIDLAGVMFRDEAERLEGRLFGSTGTKSRYKFKGAPLADARVEA